MRLDWQDLLQNVAEVHHEPLLVPSSFIFGTFFPVVGIVAVVLTIVYLVAFSVVERFVEEGASPQRKSKLCYQFTNLVFNLGVGVLGLYVEYGILPTLKINNDHRDLIIGHYNELYAVSAWQLGYQLWALPVGFFYVKESTEMLVHHWAVVISAATSGMCTIGFRYYTPFFYGVMELSSVPLSVMNAFKDNPAWMERRPQMYVLARIVFGACFLFIRIFLCAWRWPWFLFLNYLAFYTRDWGWYKLYMLLQVIMATFLAGIQYMWAFMILNGLAKMLKKRKKVKNA